MSKASTQLDSPWKEILEHYFEDFMLFFFPQVHALIDWQQGHEFLDTELRQVAREAKLGRRLADKLAKVRLRSGNTAWVYAHVEVQGQFERNFNERMFVYHYRIFDRYKQPVISLAVLGDAQEKWRPDSYSHELGGCELSFRFPVVKLLDYKDKWDELEKSNSPFSIVVRTHLKGLETRKSPEKRLHWKMRLFKSLHKAQYTQKEIQELLRFIDWMLALPDALEQEFRDAAAKYEEKKKVPYVTGIERIGIKKGILQTLREAVIETLRVRFKKIPKSLVKTIQSISDTAFLSKLHRKAILAESIQSVERIIEKESKKQASVA